MAERFQEALGQISTEMPSIEEAIFADLDSALTGEIGSGDPAKEEAKLETLEKQLEEQLKVRTRLHGRLIGLRWSYMKSLD